MKKIQLLILGIALFLLGSTKVSAQVGIRININLQPQWGPADYDYVEYYYLPEYDIYYYAPQRQFIYQNHGHWVTVRNLPAQYRQIDLYNTYKVVINEPKPYLRHTYYVEKYSNYKGQHSQQRAIRDSKDDKYLKYNEHRAHAGKEMVQREHSRNEQPQHGKGNNGKGNKRH